MILDRIVKSKHPDDKPDYSILFIIIVIVIIAAALLRIVQWANPEKTTPLLLGEEGEIQSMSVEIAEQKTTTDIVLPEDLLGSEVHLVGLYPIETSKVSQETAVVVLVKDHWRMAQISYQPNLTLGEERAKYTSPDVREVVVGEEVAYLIPVNNFYTQCFENPEGIPSLCQFTDILLFQVEGMVVTIANDNNHLTEGEIISWARSIVEQVGMDEE